MGLLSRFVFTDRLVARHPIFIETGTGSGLGIKYAQRFPFQRIVSIEAVPEVADRARKLFECDPRVEIVCADSTPGLINLLPNIKAPAIFWLDAHYPGATFVPGVGYDDELDEARRLPLRHEIAVLRDWRLSGSSIIIADDLRLYVDRQFESGGIFRSPQHASDKSSRFLKGARLYNNDGGYALWCDRRRPYPEFLHNRDARYWIEQAHDCAECGDAYGARTCYRTVVELTKELPDVYDFARLARGEACRYIAECCLADGYDGEACDWFNRAALADPVHVVYRTAFTTRGLMPLGWQTLANQEAQRAVKIAGRYGDAELRSHAHQTLALVEMERGNADEAEIQASAALELTPASAHARRIHARLLMDTGRLGQAVESWFRLTCDDPLDGDSWEGLALATDRSGDTLAALAYEDHAISIETSSRLRSSWNRAEMLLTLGRYAEGWQASHATYRLQPDFGPLWLREAAGFGRLGVRFKAPILSLDDDPCRVLVHAEQGFGDTICMARYVPMLRDAGHDVIFEVHDPLVALFRESAAFDGIEVVGRALDYPGGLGLPAFDRHVGTMSLPAIFGTDIDTVPYPGAYITPWSAHPERSGLRIAICTQSGMHEGGLWYREYHRRKSMDDDVRDRLCVTLRSFGHVVSDVTVPQGDFLHTARFLRHCDLCLSVDTATAHLAGAMGMPTWVLMHAQGSWHHLRDRHDNPWYPTMRLFRKSKDAPYDWAPVIDAIVETFGDCAVAAA